MGNDLFEMLLLWVQRNGFQKTSVSWRAQVHAFFCKDVSRKKVLVFFPQLFRANRGAEDLVEN